MVLVLAVVGLLAATVIASESYDALPCQQSPPFTPTLLNRSWSTLPTFWQGSAEELRTPEQIALAVSFSLVVVTVHIHDTESQAIGACERVKRAAPHRSCIMYWNVQLVMNHTAAGIALQSTRQNWLLRDNHGQLMLPAGRFLTVDYRIAGAGAWFLSGCANATRSARLASRVSHIAVLSGRSGWVDGCNLDGGNEFW